MLACSHDRPTCLGVEVGDVHAAVEGPDAGRLRVHGPAHLKHVPGRSGWAWTVSLLTLFDVT